MSEATKHRGPDGAGSWRWVDPATGEGVVLAHRRLAILDLSNHANQPMVDEASGQALVFNGEIYNFREIRRSLEAAGRRFHTDSDTEVLLAAFAARGTGCLEQLRGMFAFAAFDPASRTLRLVRDRFGIKPLYWTIVERPEGRRTLLFASEVRALLASGLVARELDPIGAATFLWNGFVGREHSIVTGVRSVPPATFASFSIGGLGDPRFQRYWEFPRGGSGEVSSERLRSVLEDSVAAHLVSDAPLGVFLSGGVDSSAVATLASRASADPVRTFHVSFEESGFDESPYAAEVARRIGSDHSVIRLSQDVFRAGLEDALASLDQPTFDGINSYFVSRAARDSGVKVALSGAGGDELFGGYRSFADVPRATRVAGLLRRLPGAVRSAVVRSMSAWLGRGADPAVPPQTRWGKLADVIEAGSSLVRQYQVQYALFTREFNRQLSSEVESLVTYGLEPGRQDELADEVRSWSGRHAVTRMEFEMFLGCRLLRDTDAASMASSLEVRVPFVDHVLLDAVAGSPEAVRFTPTEPKRVLRAATAPEVPANTFARPKAGFVLPIETWCRSRLGDAVGDLLMDPDVCRSCGLEPAAVASLWRAFQSGARGIYWSRVWALFTLLWWARRYNLAYPAGFARAL